MIEVNRAVSTLTTRHCEERSNPRLYRAENCLLYNYLLVSLVAKTSLFVLTQKVTKKVKTTRMLPPALPVLHAFFAVRYFVPSHHTKN